MTAEVAVEEKYGRDGYAGVDKSGSEKREHYGRRVHDCLFPLLVKLKKKRANVLWTYFVQITLPEIS